MVNIKSSLQNLLYYVRIYAQFENSDHELEINKEYGLNYISRILRYSKKTVKLCRTTEE